MTDDNFQILNFLNYEKILNWRILFKLISDGNFQLEKSKVYELRKFEALDLWKNSKSVTDDKN